MTGARGEVLYDEAVGPPNPRQRPNPAEWQDPTFSTFLRTMSDRAWEVALTELPAH